jgi:hypothetical protein
VAEDTFSAWQDADLGDGQRRCVFLTTREILWSQKLTYSLLVLASPTHALQVFAFRSGIMPDDHSVQETFPAPEEVVSVPSIVYDSVAETTALPGVRPGKPRDERALAAHILHKAHWGTHGPIVAMVMSAGSSRSGNGLLALSLVLVSLATGTAFRRLDLGSGTAAAITSSSRAIILVRHCCLVVSVLSV